MTTVAAVVGAGLIGQGWAIVFARAGWEVRLYDPNAQALRSAHRLILEQLAALEGQARLQDAGAIGARITISDALAQAVEGVAYVQENSPEVLDMKQALFSELDRLCAPGTIIASSTSGIPASRFTEHLAGRARCLVAHPVNPPYLVPVVELCGTPWTSQETVDRTRAIMQAIGQKPVTVNEEIEGFVLNRLQAAVLHEAFRLVKLGIASVEDIDTTMKDGLGLRWAFMGPFETIDLNAPGGIADYCARYGPMYASIGADGQAAAPWDEALIDELSRQRRALLREEDLPARRTWRDARLMQSMQNKE